MTAHRSRKSAANHKGTGRKKSAARPAQTAISTEEVRRLPKAPSDYERIARTFADALEATNFRGAVSAQKLRSMVARGERLAQLAAAAQTRATAADRQRMVQESQAWKSMMSAWRLVVAAMPDRPELEQPFAFMQQYMSVHHSAPTPEPAPTAVSKSAS